MGVHSDVGIAVTLKVDKLMRATLNAIAHGHEAIEMLDSMFVREQAGWKLYHHVCIKWYVGDSPIKAVHDFLTSAVDGELGGDVDYSECITYIILCSEHIHEDGGAVENHGYQADPFNLGYSFKLAYEPPPEPEEAVTVKGADPAPFTVTETEEETRNGPPGEMVKVVIVEFTTGGKQ